MITRPASLLTNLHWPALSSAPDTQNQTVGMETPLPPQKGYCHGSWCCSIQFAGLLSNVGTEVNSSLKRKKRKEKKSLWKKKNNALQVFKSEGERFHFNTVQTPSNTKLYSLKTSWKIKTWHSILFAVRSQTSWDNKKDTFANFGERSSPKGWSCTNYVPKIIKRRKKNWAKSIPSNDRRGCVNIKNTE